MKIVNVPGTHAHRFGKLAAIIDGKSGCYYQTPLSDGLTEAAHAPQV
jgi:hypothetical protein